MSGTGSAQGAPRLDPRVELRSERLRLVPLRAVDADALHPVLADERLHRFIGGVPPDLPALRERLARLEAGAPADGGAVWGNWVVREARTGAAVGTLQATIRASEAAVAWVVGSAFQGRGYASEAAEAVLAWLSSTEVVRVTAHIHPEHHASAAVARRAGLRATTVTDADGEVIWERWLRP